MNETTGNKNKTLNKTSGGRNNKSWPGSYCRVLPPGEFNGIITVPCL